MRTLFPLPAVVIPLFFLTFYGFIGWAIWKFYQVLSGINQNLAGIRDAIERQPPRA